ncbi:MAG: hypothetical protein K6347_04940 [Campylobacterales bacterium]
MISTLSELQAANNQTVRQQYRKDPEAATRLSDSLVISPAIDPEKAAIWQQIRSLNEMTAVIDFAEGAGERPPFSKNKLWDELKMAFSALMSDRMVEGDIVTLNRKVLQESHHISYLQQQADRLLKG